MACTNCQDSNGSVSVFDIQYIYNTNCTDCNTQCGGNIVDSKCVAYVGPNLPCSTISTNDSIELALQKIDEILCSTAGDYSTYNIHCLPGPITTEAQFVDVISQYVCTLNTTLTDFTTTTFPSYQTTVDSRFDAIEVPGITCSSASVVNTDTLVQVLNKYCTKFSQIDSNVDLSAVDWDQCFTVGANPTNVHEGFDLLIDQICQVKTLASSATALPTFNNVGSCLPTPGAADSLEDTITKIKTRLCQTGTFTIAGMTWGCVSSGTDLQSTLQNIITKVGANSAGIPTFSSDFTVTNVDNSNPCLGVNVALATPLNVDRYVAATSSDTSPGVLQDKLSAGSGITFDYSTTPGKVIINGSSGTGDHKVLASSTDDTPDYLNNKISGGSDGPVSITPSYDTVSKTVVLQPTFDMGGLVTSIRTYLETNPTEKALWCQLFADCPSPCSQPQNVSVVYISGGGTTTTTTTTTTTP